MQAKKSVPAILWVAIISMGIFACLHLIVGFSKPVQLIAFVVNLVLLFGLYSGKKWAYVITIIASLAAPFALLSQNTGLSFVILLMNSFVLIPVLLTTRYFFPENSGESARV